MKEKKEKRLFIFPNRFDLLGSNFFYFTNTIHGMINVKGINTMNFSIPIKLIFESQYIHYNI